MGWNCSCEFLLDNHLVMYTTQVSVGRQKAMKLSDRNFRLEPTPECDAHISCERAKPDDPIVSAWKKSQVLHSES